MKIPLLGLSKQQPQSDNDIDSISCCGEEDFEGSALLVPGMLFCPILFLLGRGGRKRLRSLKHLLQNRRDEFLLSLWHLIHLWVFTPLFDKLNRLFSTVSSGPDDNSGIDTTLDIDDARDNSDSSEDDSVSGVSSQDAVSSIWALSSLSVKSESSDSDCSLYRGRSNSMMDGEVYLLVAGRGTQQTELHSMFH